MKLSIRGTLGIIAGASVFYLYVTNTRPVGWFDAVVGLILFAVVFLFIKRFKGFKR
jgi:uncharacterized BrkB/YihY/UPF0761 family membrane protein